MERLRFPSQGEFSLRKFEKINFRNCFNKNLKNKSFFLTGGYILPKGSSAVLVILKVHRNEKHWLDPLKFNPDRFVPEEIAKRHPYSYIPFSAGPRNCIGIILFVIITKNSRYCNRG